jgi:hypothetical protein
MTTLMQSLEKMMREPATDDVDVTFSMVMASLAFVGPGVVRKAEDPDNVVSRICLATAKVRRLSVPSEHARSFG